MRVSQPPDRPSAESLIPDRTAAELKHPDASPLVRLALDLGPLLAFFAGYALTREVFLSTAIFMGVTAIAMVVSRIVTGRVSAMQWFSGVMVLLLGGATLLLHDESIIKMKPTAYYLVVASILGFGLWSGRPTLKLVLGASFPGLRERGWQLLTRNWALFFLVMALSNELVWRHSSTGFWLGYKLWGVMPATVLFGLANLPMLMRHGLNAEAKPPEISPPGTVQ